MKEAALFFVDYLVRDPKTGWLISGPSNSPEQGGLVMGPTMDHQIIRGLFAWTAEAARMLGVDGDLAERLTRMRARDRAEPDRPARPAAGVARGQGRSRRTRTATCRTCGASSRATRSRRSTPELFAAARQSLELRGDGGTGWSLGWKIAFWARFLDGDHAHRMILKQLTAADPRPRAGRAAAPTRTSSTPTRRSRSTATSAPRPASPRCCCRARTATLDLLPALPTAWRDGSVKGLRARGGFEVDLVWRGGALERVTLRSSLGRPVQLRSGGQTRALETTAGGTIILDGRLRPVPR